MDSIHAFIMNGTYFLIHHSGSYYLIPYLYHYQLIVHFSGMWLSRDDIMHLGSVASSSRGLRQHGSRTTSSSLGACKSSSVHFNSCQAFVPSSSMLIVGK